MAAAIESVAAELRDRAGKGAENYGCKDEDEGGNRDFGARRELDTHAHSTRRERAKQHEYERMLEPVARSKEPDPEASGPKSE